MVWAVDRSVLSDGYPKILANRAEPACARAARVGTLGGVNRQFWRHYLQMLAAMVVAMMILEPLRMVVVDALGWSGAFDRVEPLALAMAAEMSVGMVAWMRFRGHGWQPTLEMCAAMFVPFLVLFVPYWAGVLGADAVMVGGHVLMLPAMALVLLRRPGGMDQHPGPLARTGET